MVDAYSRLDLTVVMYASLFRSFGLPFRFLFMKPSFWFADEATFCMWVAHERSLEISTPKYFSWETPCRNVPHSSYICVPAGGNQSEVAERDSEKSAI